MKDLIKIYVSTNSFVTNPQNNAISTFFTHIFAFLQDLSKKKQV